MTRTDDHHEHVMAIMRGFDTGMPVSTTAEAALRARPMAIAKLAATGELWFITNRNSGKIDEIIREPSIAITLQNTNQYVSLSGDAKLIDDRGTLEELWAEAWKVWFPGGKDDPSIILVHFIPKEIEYWDNAGTKGLRYLFRAGVAYLQGETPEVDESMHARLTN